MRKITNGLYLTGAAIGAKKKDNSILNIAIEENGSTYHIQLRADQKKYNQFTSKVL